MVLIATACVYIIRSASSPTQKYVGLTHNLKERLAAHNRGVSPHTARYRPWRLVVSVEFADERRAIDFEKYLKSGSGRAFAERHFHED